MKTTCYFLTLLALFFFNATLFAQSEFLSTNTRWMACENKQLSRMGASAVYTYRLKFNPNDTGVLGVQIELKEDENGNTYHEFFSTTFQYSFLVLDTLSKQHVSLKLSFGELEYENQEYQKRPDLAAEFYRWFRIEYYQPLVDYLRNLETEIDVEAINDKEVRVEGALFENTPSHWYFFDELKYPRRACLQ